MKSYSKITLLIFFLLFGIMAGSYLSGDMKAVDESFGGNVNREEQAEEVAELQKSIEEQKQKIKELAANVDAYEQEWATENIALNKLISDVNIYKMLAGHSGAAGPGIRIILEGTFQENIAVLVEQEKYLLNLVNELRYFGAEVITINGSRLTARSEIGYAGNHINVNGVAIAPPYEIQAIGSIKSFQRYVEHGTFLFESMESEGIKSIISFEDELTVSGLLREKPIEFLKIVDESN